MTPPGGVWRWYTPLHASTNPAALMPCSLTLVSVHTITHPLCPFKPYIGFFLWSIHPLHHAMICLVVYRLPPSHRSLLSRWLVCTSSVSTPIECPMRGHCPLASFTQVQCPSGLYSKSTNMDTVATCIPPCKTCSLGVLYSTQKLLCST